MLATACTGISCSDSNDWCDDHDGYSFWTTILYYKILFRFSLLVCCWLLVVSWCTFTRVWLKGIFCFFSTSCSSRFSGIDCFCNLLIKIQFSLCTVSLSVGMLLVKIANVPHLSLCVASVACCLAACGDFIAFWRALRVTSYQLRVAT